MIVACADVGSTFTKVSIVDTTDGRLLANAAHRTTVDSDVLHGLDAAIAATGHRPHRTYACSSAGGGLRLAVVGYERLVTAETGQRVGLSAGARVVHVAAGPLDRAAITELRRQRPDVVLLVGGTDGGDADVLLHNGARLAAARLQIPVVLAGNADARDTVTETLNTAGVPVIAVDNVLPRIGRPCPGPARAAIREVFLRHVIGGKRLSRGSRFARLVRAATPDAVLAAVELLGENVAVVDVGGATTDVYSVLEPDATQVAGSLWAGRTVEGDLGVRWNALGIVEAARAERLLADKELQTAARMKRLPTPDELDAAARERAANPGLLADDPTVDLRLAGLAATIALRRHARDARRDLRGIRLVVGSGGVLRHAPKAAARAVLAEVLNDHSGGWAPPRAPHVVLDDNHVLAAAGLLANEHPEAAAALLSEHIGSP